MLIRFFVQNVFSFGEEKEFNMIPNPNGKREQEHKYAMDGFHILKLSSIYGANAAGKSNLIMALHLLRDIVVYDKINVRQPETQFKFRDEKEMSQILGVEFFQNGKAYYYALQILGTTIEKEELYESGLGRKEDQLVYERKTDEKGKTTILFFAEFEKEEENRVLKKVIEENLSKPNQPLMTLLTTLNKLSLQKVQQALDWFRYSLMILTPESRPVALAHMIDHEPPFRQYAQETVKALQLGISELKVETKSVKDFFGEGQEERIDSLIRRIESSPLKQVPINYDTGEEIVAVKEGEGYFVKQLTANHIGKQGRTALFRMPEESDGTQRILDLLPAFKDVFSNEIVYLIDEIERSIHPILIKELVRKFAADTHTKGQLIFTTHETNLLDQHIFRQDEIWLTEKDKNGCSDLYSLSDFKVHSTIDIQKGYLTGRYGSIPFLGNLQDLNWHNYDTTE